MFVTNHMHIKRRGTRWDTVVNGIIKTSVNKRPAGSFPTFSISCFLYVSTHFSMNLRAVDIIYMSLNIKQYSTNFMNPSKSESKRTGNTKSKSEKRSRRALVDACCLSTLLVFIFVQKVQMNHQCTPNYSSAELRIPGKSELNVVDGSMSVYVLSRGRAHL